MSHEPISALGEALRRRPIDSQRAACRVAARLSMAALGPVHSDDAVRDACIGLATGLFGDAYAAAGSEERHRMVELMEEEYRGCLRRAHGELADNSSGEPK